jgi:hypothetical protein
MARAKITYAAPKWRDPITDPQVILFCRLVDDLIQAIRSSSEAVSSMPEYERFMLGADACGFVCCDLTADLAILSSAEKPGWIEKARFKDLRLYIHSLLRAERRFQKQPSEKVTPLHTALRNGVLARLCSRLRTEQSWRGL